MSSFPLPDELIALILDALYVPYLLRCMQVCKEFQSIIQQSSALLYKISLFSAHMSDVEHCNWDFPSRLDAIRRYTDAWNNLKFPTRKQILMEDGQAWDLVNGVLTQACLHGGISCVQMPCSIKGIPEHRWVAPTDFQIRDFTIDISQDLLVAMELSGDGCILHLRSCTTGSVHPKATCPRIVTANILAGGVFPVSFLIRVCGPHVGILFVRRPENRAFVIWDWRTGSLKMLIRGSEFRSFTFMSDEVLLAAFLEDGQVSLKVLSVALDSVSSAKDVQPLCELRYPGLRVVASDILIISEPIPASTVSNLSAAPFTCSSTDILFTVTLTYFMGSAFESAIVLLVPRSVILYQASRVSSSPQKYIDWELWGPQGSRILDIQPSDVWVCHSYGMKFVYGPDDQHAGCLYDFNPYATRKVVNTANRPGLPWKPMEKETKISGTRNPFDTDVVTSLPGCGVSLDILLLFNEDGWEATMITGDHIVMVQSGHAERYVYLAM